MLKAEIADSPVTLANGLMFRKKLEANEGMLFKFDSPTFSPFWGKNTYIPLDIAFVDKNNRIIDIKKITPMSTKAVNCSDIYHMAIETNDGFFEKNGIKIGHKVVLKNEENDKVSYIDFQEE